MHSLIFTELDFGEQTNWKGKKEGKKAKDSKERRLSRRLSNYRFFRSALASASRGRLYRTKEDEDDIFSIAN